MKRINLIIGFGILLLVAVVLIYTGNQITPTAAGSSSATTTTKSGTAITQPPANATPQRTQNAQSATPQPTPANASVVTAPTAVPLPSIVIPTPIAVVTTTRTPASVNVDTNAQSATTAAVNASAPTEAVPVSLEALRGKIVFFSDRGGAYPQLYVMNADGSDPQLCNCSDLLETLVVGETNSPDNKQFLFVKSVGGSARGGADFQIWAHNNATNYETVVTGAAPGFPLWTTTRCGRQTRNTSRGSARRMGAMKSICMMRRRMRTSA